MAVLRQTGRDLRVRTARDGRLRRHGALLFRLLAAGMVFCAVMAPAQTRQPTESEVKAAFLFNFLKYVDWPTAVFSNASQPYIIGIIGEGPVNPVLEQVLKSKQINDRPVEARRLGRDDDPSACHILFINRSERESVQRLLSMLKGKPVLTVGESEDFMERGGMLQFYLSGDGKVRLRVNVESAEKSNLKISSNLLRLCTIWSGVNRVSRG